MAIVSSGQITIVDYNDAVSLSGFIGANLALTQIYNPDNSVYTPDFASTNLVLTPSLFASITGGTDVITQSTTKSIKWFDGAVEIVAGASYGYPVFTAGQNRPLTIKTNILAGAVMSKTFMCEIVYTDATTLSDLTYRCSITINRINNGGGATIAQVTTPSGMVYKNGAGATLTAVAQLLRASGIDVTNNTYQWYKYVSALPDEGAGIGWDKLDGTTNYGTTGYATDTLTIPNSAVVGLAMFKCTIKDNDASSGTYNQTFSATCTIVDQTDPIQVSVVSSAGDVLKNGTGSTTLTAKLYQNGAEVDASATKYTYKWYKADKNGVSDANFGGAGVAFKTGKTLAVGGADVDVKAIFTVEIS